MTTDDNDQDRAYEVGYKKPPRDSQFKKGTSGNPDGRPRNSRNFKTLIKNGLNEKITVRENGTVQELTKLEIFAKNLINNGIRNDSRSLPVLLAIIQSLDAEHEERAALAGKNRLAGKDAEIIARFGDRFSLQDKGENYDT